MKTCEIIKRLPAIIYAKILTHQPGFQKRTPHEQILFLKNHGINFMDVGGWGKPTPRQQEAIDHGATHSIAEPKMDGEYPRSK